MTDTLLEKSTIDHSIKQIVDRTMNMDMNWNWECGVAYYGVCRAYEVTGEESYLSRVQERVDELISLGFGNDWTVNQCAMGHSLLTLYEKTGNEKYWELIMSMIDYLTDRAPRFGESILQHTVSSANDFPGQAWADTMFMAAFFMLRVGVKTENDTLIEDALNQYYGHIKCLQDPSSGLFYHGYDSEADNHLSGVFWGRANPWAALTMSKVGVTLPKAYLYPKFMDVLGSLREQLSALKLLQTDNGLWRTILDDAESYEETSTSVGIANALLVSGNPLYRKYVKKSLIGLLSNIAEDGRVLNVSAGTAVMNDEKGYLTVSKDWTHGWGQGLMLSFLADLLYIENKNTEKSEESHSSKIQTQGD